MNSTRSDGTEAGMGVTSSPASAAGDPGRESARLLMTRRRFLANVGTFGLAAALSIDFVLPDGTLVIPNSEGFLLVDLKKCQGCGTCMMACVLAHAGEASYSLARIQIQQDSFVNWPDDVYMAVCRQCQDAPCVQVCPVGANLPDGTRGNVRVIDPGKCIGCKSCIARCPFQPARIQWDPRQQKSQKCDLCIHTPYLGEPGGPGGAQACIQVCPVGAIAFTPHMPAQTPDGSAYEANLRGPAWEKLGMTSK
jgi:protein NrfC